MTPASFVALVSLECFHPSSQSIMVQADLANPWSWPIDLKPLHAWSNYVASEIQLASYPGPTSH